MKPGKNKIDEKKDVTEKDTWRNDAREAIPKTGTPDPPREES